MQKMLKGLVNVEGGDESVDVVAGVGDEIGKQFLQSRRNHEEEEREIVFCVALRRFSEGGKSVPVIGEEE